MFPYLTRILWILLQPVSVVVLLMLLGLVLLWLRRPRLGALSVGVAALLIFTMSYTTFGYTLIAPLEARFERPPVEPARVDGIVVLGGAMDADVTTARGNWELSRSGDRFVEALRLALRHPEAKILIAGGGSAIVSGQETEAEAGARFFRDFGIAPERLLLEDQSRNTEENAQNAKVVGQPQPGQTWLLVTSAFHMSRSVGLFRRAAFDVIPWPTDYLSAGNEGIGLKPSQAAENLAISQIALKEWIGLWGYYLTGRTDDLVSSPLP